jgi:hypothetical protein
VSDVVVHFGAAPVLSVAMNDESRSGHPISEGGHRERMVPPWV